MSWQTARFPVDICASVDHGEYGRYTGKASSERETEDAPWTVLLSHRSQVVHTVTVQSCRHAEYVLHAWTGERIAPDVADVAEARA